MIVRADDSCKYTRENFSRLTDEVYTRVVIRLEESVILYKQLSLAVLRSFERFGMQYKKKAMEEWVQVE